MTFEEDFPSLKDKNVVRCVDGTWFYRSENINPQDESGMYSGLIVNKYCLDKQKVREVISAYLCKSVCRNNTRVAKYKECIFKELGL